MKKTFLSGKWKAVLVVSALVYGFAAQAQLAVNSPAFANNGVIPDPFTYNLGAQCSGSNWSPPLDITNIPAGTQTLVVRMADITVPWLHWKVWDIAVPAAQTSLSLPYNAAASLPAATQAINGFGAGGYGGPCPPAGGAHSYVFTVYALTTAAGGGEPTDAMLNALPAARQGTLTGLRANGDRLAWAPPGAPSGVPTGVPTLSELGLALTGLLLAGLAGARIRRRRE